MSQYAKLMFHSAKVIVSNRQTFNLKVTQIHKELSFLLAVLSHQERSICTQELVDIDIAALSSSQQIIIVPLVSHSVADHLTCKCLEPFMEVKLLRPCKKRLLLNTRSSPGCSRYSIMFLLFLRKLARHR